MRTTKSTLMLAALLVMSSGCASASSDGDSTTTDPSPSSSQGAVTESPGSEDDSTSAGPDQSATPTTSQPNAACQYIDTSDMVIRLDLPEEYAHENDATVFPSYQAGFTFKSSHGDVAVLHRLARKVCDYRVGFSSQDFAELNLNPNYPLVISAQASSSMDFTYVGDPTKLKLGSDGLPEAGRDVVVKVTGTTPAYGHYDAIFS